MKIGFDAKRAFANATGLGHYSRNLLRAFFAYHKEEDYYLYTPDRNEDFEKDFLSSDAKVIEPSGLIYKNAKSLWRSKGISSSIKKEKLDVYHGLSHELPSGIAKTGAKSIVTIHDLIYLRFPDHYPAIDRKIYNKKFKSACKNADLIVAISEQTKADIIEFFGTDADKIKVIYQSCHPMYYEEMPWNIRHYMVESYNLQNQFILNVGSFTPRKNQMTLLKAFNIIHQKNKDIDLVLVGNGKDYKEEMKDYIEENDLFNNVLLIDNCTTERLVALYQLASVVAYPSLFEGFGIPILEAMFSKTPVITSTGSCFAEVGGEHSIYVDPKDADALADNIIDVLGDEQKARAMAAKGFERAQQFKDEIIAEQMMSTYKSL